MRRHVMTLPALLLAVVFTLLAGVLWSPASAAPAAPGLLTTRDVCTTCAYTSIQAAIDASADGDTIRVAGGAGVIYAERLTISGTLHILGGYSGPAGGWQRDLVAYPATIDGQSGGSVVTVLAGAPTIEGFIITGGLSPVDGGGLLIQAASPLISATTVISNSAASSGGGIAVYGGSPRLANSAVLSNTAMGGGGLLIADGSTMQIDSSTIAHNMAAFIGGGLLVVGSSAPVVSGATIEDNRSPVGGGMLISDSGGTISGTQIVGNRAEAGFGGGISLNSSDVTLQASVIISNTASADGGGVHAENSAPLVQGCVIRGNSAGGGGGGLSLLSSLGSVTASDISANQASGASGGGVLLDRAAPLLDGNTLAGNSALLNGGAVAVVGRYCPGDICESPRYPQVVNSLLAGNSAAGKGGGIHIDAGSGPDLVNNTVVGNAGAGVYIDAYAQANLTNSIIVSNTTGIDAAVPSAPFADHNLVWGNIGSDNNLANYVGLPAGAHDVSLDPRFVAPAALDFHLGAQSPALDAGQNAGAPAADHDGVVRPQVGVCGGQAVVDMGAYEYVLPAGACAAAFTGAPLTGHPPLAVVFTNQSTPGATFLWSFGDGITSTEIAPSHVYTAAGSYTVTLTAVGITSTHTVTKTGYVQPYTFDDVPPTHPDWLAIEAVKRAGVTAGCNLNPPLFCPDGLVKREEIAVFIDRALGWDPAPLGVNQFTDMANGYWATPFAETLRAHGVTAGCQAAGQPLRYCPLTVLSKAEIATMVRAAAGWAPASPPQFIFADARPGDWFTPHVEAFYAHTPGSQCGVDAGSGKLLFCPLSQVTRAYMAELLASVFGL